MLSLFCFGLCVTTIPVVLSVCTLSSSVCLGFPAFFRWNLSHLDGYDGDMAQKNQGSLLVNERYTTIFEKTAPVHNGKKEWCCGVCKSRTRKAQGDV